MGLATVALLMLGGAVLTLVQSPAQASSIAPWLPTFLIGSAVMTAICAIGAFFKQRWSAYIYAAWHIVVTAFGILVLRQFSVTAFIVRSVVVVLLFYLFYWVRERAALR